MYCILSTMAPSLSVFQKKKQLLNSKYDTDKAIRSIKRLIDFEIDVKMKGIGPVIETKKFVSNRNELQAGHSPVKDVQYQGFCNLDTLEKSR